MPRSSLDGLDFAPAASGQEVTVTLQRRPKLNSPLHKRLELSFPVCMCGIRLHLTKNPDLCEESPACCGDGHKWWAQRKSISAAKTTAFGPKRPSALPWILLRFFERPLARSAMKPTSGVIKMPPPLPSSYGFQMTVSIAADRCCQMPNFRYC